MSRTCTFLHSALLDSGGYPPQVPFDSHRAGKTRELCASMGLLGGPGNEEVAPVKASRAELEMFHSPEYMDLLVEAGQGRLPAGAPDMGIGTPDCPPFAGMYEYCAIAAGASVTGARRIIDGGTRIAFNPSGGFHHAHPRQASGFCYVNDVAIAALVLAEAKKRVLVLDVDAHHCDGVQDAFDERADVMVVSLHEDARTLFPGTGGLDETGRRAGAGYTANIPLPAGTYNGAYRRAFERIALPLVQWYGPDVVILELGMDGLHADPLAHLDLTNEIHVEIVEAVMGLGVPVLAVGGGGYDIERTVRSWTLAWAVLCGRYHGDLSAGLGGVMLQNTEWVGGLLDLPYLPPQSLRNRVDAEVERIIARATALHPALRQERR